MLLVDNGVLSGYPDGLFKPEAFVTRSEFALMMTVALGVPLITPAKPTFEDIGINDWEYTYVESAKKYLTGYESGGKFYFRGNANAVREDMTVALVKALGLESELREQSRADAMLRRIFSDTGDISPNLRPFVLAAYENGLINGYPDGTFGPQKSITRAEAAALLVKVLRVNISTKVTFD